MSKQINIRTSPAESGFIEIVWSDAKESHFPAYRVYVESLSDRVNAVRSGLQKLYRAYLHPRPNYVDALGSLSDLGYELRTTLFEGGPPEDQNLAAEVKDWFVAESANSPDNVVITAHMDPMLPIPWGLIHDHGSKDAGDPYEGFWALQYEIAALYNGMAPKQLRPRENVRLLSGLNEEVYEACRRDLDPAHRDFIASFVDIPVGKAFTKNGCRQRWQQVGDNDCIFHFFGHASGSALRFSDSDIFTADDFRTIFRRYARSLGPRKELYVLSFLNGCSVVSGQGAKSFLVATAYPGFCGFIGPEAVVPDRFAIMFGQELLYSLLIDGLSVRQSMSHLWRKHNPMAIFYGCYAQPDFTIAPLEKQGKLPPDFNLRNFYAAPKDT